MVKNISDIILDYVSNGHVHVWQCQAENVTLFVAYFDRIAAFEALYLRISSKGGVHTRHIATADIAATMCCICAPALLEFQRYRASNTAVRSKYATEYCLFLPNTATHHVTDFEYEN